MLKRVGYILGYNTSTALELGKLNVYVNVAFA